MRPQDIGSWGLLGVVVTQVLLYTTLFDIHFFLRNAAVIGGLLVLVSVEDPNRSNQMRAMMQSGLAESGKCVRIPRRSAARPPAHMPTSFSFC